MCSVENCSNEVSRRGMCSLHYRRTLRGAPLGGSEPLHQTIRHGLERHPLYHTWEQMRERCRNTKKSNYKYYGAKGVKVCERWNNFENFLADVGEKPTAKHTLDRKNPFGNYEPGNIRWATPKEQRANQRKALNKKVG